MKAVWVVVSVALVLGATVFLPATAVDPEPDVFRFVHVYSGQPVSSYSCTKSDQEVLCAGSVPDDVSFAVPTGLGRVDVTASLTVEYHTSAGDGALLTATLNPPVGKKEEMRPGSFALGGSPGTTTTVTWFAPNEQPADGEFAFGFEISGARGNDLPYRVAVSEAVLVITATPG